MSRALVLVHGIFSSGKTWNSLKLRIAADDHLASLFVATFDYYTPRFRFNPARVIPDHDDIALKLWTFLERKLDDYEKLTIIAHSQGGLIAQRMLSRQVEAGAAKSLARIHQVVLLACPNSGSDLFLALRRYTFPWRHPQERGLRPLDKEIERTRSTVLEKVVYAKEVTSTSCPIVIHAYAGESDGVVKSQSALSAFPNKGVLEGDHSTILDFENPDGLNYSVIRHHILSFLRSDTKWSERQLQQVQTGMQQVGVMPRPAQLPRAVPDLRGRDDEIKQIHGVLVDSPQANASRVIVITGCGGIGKTALAINAGALAKTAFVDGILFADLGGTKMPPLDADAILLSFVISLGVPPELASSAGVDKVGLYRSAMSGRRLLVLLDNASSPEQVERLLPSEPLCAVIITSRSRFSSMRLDLRIGLGPISDESAKQVLSFYLDTETECRPDRDQLMALVALCGRWPLVLHLAGALITRRSASSVRDLIVRLGDEKTRLDSLLVGEVELRVVLEDSVRQLGADGATLFRRLSLISGSSAPAWSLEILLRAGTVRSRSALAELIEANLIEASPEAVDERYTMHDLVRDMSREKMSAENPEGSQEVKIALLRAYRNRAVLSRRVLEPDRPPYGSMDPNLSTDESALLADIGSPERWLEAEKRALIDSVDEAFKLGLDDIAISIANSLPTYFVIRGTWNEWSTAYETAIRAAERSRDLVGLGYLLQGLANVQRTKGQGTGAPLLERSLACFLDAGDVVGQAYVLNDIGLVRMYDGRWADADEALQKSERELLANGHPIMALQPRRNHAISLLERGETARAARELETVCDEMDRQGDVRWRAYSLADLGKAYRLLGSVGIAVECLQTAINVMLRIGDSRWAAVTRIRLGDVYRSAARPAEADVEYVRALELFNELADSVWGARALLSRALVAIDEMRLDQAMSLCTDGHQAFVALSSKKDECWSLVVQSRIYAAMGSEEAASTALGSARSLARDIGRDGGFVDQLLTDTGPGVR